MLLSSLEAFPPKPTGNYKGKSKTFPAGYVCKFLEEAKLPIFSFHFFLNTLLLA
jgi:hypothetical protein